MHCASLNLATIAIAIATHQTNGDRYDSYNENHECASHATNSCVRLRHYIIHNNNNNKPKSDNSIVTNSRVDDLTVHISNKRTVMSNDSGHFAVDWKHPDTPSPPLLSFEIHQLHSSDVRQLMHKKCSVQNAATVPLDVRNESADDGSVGVNDTDGGDKVFDWEYVVVVVVLVEAVDEVVNNSLHA